MRDLGFAASALTRAVCGVSFCAAAFILVWVIERPRSTAHEVVREPVMLGAARSMPLTIESTYRVQQWSVSILGHEQPGTRTDGYMWAGMISAAPDSEILITASAVPPAPAVSAATSSGVPNEAAPHHSLRIMWDEAPPRLVWGGGDITTTVVVTGSVQAAAATNKQVSP